jgi:hypothetical protein
MIRPMNVKQMLYAACSQKRFMSILRLTSKSQLADDILYLYINTNFFSFIDPSTVLNIHRNVLEERYYFSPLTFIHELSIVRPTINDNLVLTALAYMLTKNIFEKEKFLNPFFSFFREGAYKDFRSKLVEQGQVYKLYYLDLKPSLATISHSHLLRKMERVVTDKYIISLIADFLSLKIFDLNGEEWTSEDPAVSIPPVEPIAGLLFNFVLDDLGVWFS